MFQSLSLPHLLLESFYPTWTLQEGRDHPLHGRDQTSAWIWTGEGRGWEGMRTRSSAGVWRCLISNMLSHFLDTSIFPPPFIFSQVQWQSPVLCSQEAPISGALGCPCFASCLSQNKVLPSIQNKHSERQFHYTDTGLKEMPSTIGNNQKRILVIAFKRKKRLSSFKMSILTFQ